jgi:hypothetical protein
MGRQKRPATAGNRGVTTLRFDSPWQNGIAERWVGSARREMLDHAIPLNEQHLRRLGRAYLAYYHDDRTHIGLEKATPAGRPTEARPTVTGEILALPFKIEHSPMIVRPVTASVGRLPDMGTCDARQPTPTGAGRDAKRCCQPDSEVRHGQRNRSSWSC